MKYIITESKLESVILNYLDNQNFIKVKRKKDIIFFMNNLDDKFVIIAYDKNKKSCYVNYSLIELLFNVFSLPTPMSILNTIIKWVEMSVNDVVEHSHVFSESDYDID